MLSTFHRPKQFHRLKNPTFRMAAKIKILLMFSVSSTILFFLSVITDQLNVYKQRSCSCEKCLSEDKMFQFHHVSHSVKPFLTAKSELSEEDYAWWKHIQRERGNYSTYKAAVKELFEIFPAEPDYEKPSSDRCRTCSVVGNSANLLKSHYGPLIDSQDIVIRINYGKVKGYEEDVGSKTTHRVMYPESASRLDNTTHLVLFAFKIKDLQWLKKAFLTGFFGRSHSSITFANKDLVMVANPALMKHAHVVWLKKKGYYPSTGFMTLILALHMCDEVHVFGFGADSDGNWSHYFEVLRNKKLKTGNHPGQQEFAVLEELANQKTIKFYRGY
ncbi:CMP-N-acetylneuraminate-beta-galactosamide-alpha-2,3-sialyltransferase 1-like isoform X1 [Kryptolebias marmoratus]|uniref:CMP-N-acetylneuraminate-beta-galactosamide- alpha-2,3-sialyltransferase 1-like isoform X1 n=2 Tax=Kryptolebias marmoratus TaxID=37003 RepID=UPI0018ACF266|nr:CMP-N-acetylneuraminate-beta-galactosamide-alpha-2,3-sialyltransferase 1-like isoform X1 [Kryptolebias marmoratus]